MIETCITAPVKVTAALGFEVLGIRLVCRVSGVAEYLTTYLFSLTLSSYKFCCTSYFSGCSFSPV